MQQSVWERFTEAVGPCRVTGTVLWQNGEKVAEHHFDAEHRRNQYSASKSFTALAVGIAEKEGLLSLDERIAGCFPEELPDDPDPRLLALTVRDALAMRLGQAEPCLMGGDRLHVAERNWVRYALSRPFSDEPGARFLYNNAGPYLAGRLVQKRAGCDLVSYLTPRFFSLAGIYRPTWETDPEGYTFGAGGLMLSVGELAHWGLLFLNGGRYAGRQVVLESFVREATALQIETDGKGDAGFGYGLGLWLGKNGSFRADGKYGQYALVLRDKNAVLAVNAESRRPQKILDAFWEIVYPVL